jgi:hypothetical protein
MTEEEFFQECFEKVKARINFDFVQNGLKLHKKYCDRISESSAIPNEPGWQDRRIALIEFRNYFVVTQMRMNGMFAGFVYYESHRTFPDLMELNAMIFQESVEISHETFREISDLDRQRYPLRLYFSEANKFNLNDEFQIESEISSCHIWIACMAEFCAQCEIQDINAKIRQGIVSKFEVYIVKMGMQLALHAIEVNYAAIIKRMNWGKKSA